LPNREEIAMPVRPSLTALPLGAVLLLAALASTAGCVSIEPWRDCAAPCQGRQLERAREIEVCKTNGFPLYLKHARWDRDERGELLAGLGRSRPGQRWAPVKVYASEIQEIRVQRLEPRRIATNVALLPAALAFQALTGEQEEDLLDEDEPEPCPPP